MINDNVKMYLENPVKTGFKLGLGFLLAQVIFAVTSVIILGITAGTVTTFVAKKVLESSIEESK